MKTDHLALNAYECEATVIYLTDAQILSLFARNMTHNDTIFIGVFFDYPTIHVDVDNIVRLAELLDYMEITPALEQNEDWYEYLKDNEEWAKYLEEKE